MKAKGACQFDYLAGMPGFRLRLPCVPQRPLGRLRAVVAALCVMAPILVTRPPVQAQPTSDLLDVGSFTLLVDGQRVGREQFSVRRATTVEGAAIELRSESAAGEQRAAVRLEADSAGTPLRYSIETRTGATVSLRLGGQRVRGRFTTLSRSVTGESAREYLLSAGALILEDEGIVQHTLLVRNRRMSPGDSLRIATLTPVQNRYGVLTLTLEATSDTVAIAGSRRVASRFRAVTASGEVRLVWSDADGRLLRVRIPDRKLEALRDDVPR